MFSGKEAEYLRARSICRLATVSEQGEPHNVPVGYAFDGNYFYISTKYRTKKLRNARKNPHVALVVDEIQKEPKKRFAVVVTGELQILERGEAFHNAREVLKQERGWGNFQEGEQAILKIRPVKKTSWGFE